MASLKWLLPLLWLVSTSESLLYPRDSETRSSFSLDGVWAFRAQPALEPQLGFANEWFSAPLHTSGHVIDMPVPASYNDITTNVTLRDHVGWVWYDRGFFVPAALRLNRTVKVRVGAASHNAIVWVNGIKVAEHEGGYLPFEADITSVLDFEDENRITIAVNNTLTPTSIPQGKWEWKQASEDVPAGYFSLTYNFDFFNYGGIHRPVLVYSVPSAVSVSDVTVVSRVFQDVALRLPRLVVDDIDDDNDRDHVHKASEKAVKRAVVAEVWYNVSVESDTDDFTCSVYLVDKLGEEVSSESGCSGVLVVTEPKLWWPIFMNADPGYMYTLKVVASVADGTTDVYRLPVGIREVSWDNSTLAVNGRSVYMRGFGRHEDSFARGKGLDVALLAKDFDLMKWTGANSFRTSHYPYAEEVMDMADRHGFMVIDECEAVAINGFGAELLARHKSVMTELVARDKNHPSVIAWSLTNEPDSGKTESKAYFEAVAQHTRSLDATRPLMMVVAVDVNSEQAAGVADLIGINRYFAWYSDTGRLDVISRKLGNDLRRWRDRFGKPVMLSEYGADTVAGFHEQPPTVFTEEYQVALFRENFAALDAAAANSSQALFGEMVWNFADFMTKQDYTRVWGNRKGVFTRDRKPKAAAHLLRQRYTGMIGIK